MLYDHHVQVEAGTRRYINCTNAQLLIVILAVTKLTFNRVVSSNIKDINKDVIRNRQQEKLCRETMQCNEQRTFKDNRNIINIV